MSIGVSTLKDSEGETPLHLAVLMLQKDVAKLLLAKGADVNAKDIPLNKNFGFVIAPNKHGLWDMNKSWKFIKEREHF